MTTHAHNLDALKAKHGEVWTLTRNGKTFVVRCPEAVEYRRFITSVADDRKLLFDAQDRLVRHAVVAPEAGALGELLDKRPGLVPWIAGEVGNIAADLDEGDAKKA